MMWCLFLSFFGTYIFTGKHTSIEGSSSFEDHFCSEESFSSDGSMIISQPVLLRTADEIQLACLDKHKFKLLVDEQRLRDDRASLRENIIKSFFKFKKEVNETKITLCSGKLRRNRFFREHSVTITVSPNINFSHFIEFIGKMGEFDIKIENMDDNCIESLVEAMRFCNPLFLFLVGMRMTENICKCLEPFSIEQVNLDLFSIKASELYLILRLKVQILVIQFEKIEFDQTLPFVLNDECSEVAILQKLDQAPLAGPGPYGRGCNISRGYNVFPDHTSRDFSSSEFVLSVDQKPKWENSHIFGEEVTCEMQRKSFESIFLGTPRGVLNDVYPFESEARSISRQITDDNSVEISIHSKKNLSCFSFRTNSKQIKLRVGNILRVRVLRLHFPDETCLPSILPRCYDTISLTINLDRILSDFTFLSRTNLNEILRYLRISIKDPLIGALNQVALIKGVFPHLLVFDFDAHPPRLLPPTDDFYALNIQDSESGEHSCVKLSSQRKQRLSVKPKGSESLLWDMYTKQKRSPCLFSTSSYPRLHDIEKIKDQNEWDLFESSNNMQNLRIKRTIKFPLLTRSNSLLSMNLISLSMKIHENVLDLVSLNFPNIQTLEIIVVYTGVRKKDHYLEHSLCDKLNKKRCPICSPSGSCEKQRRKNESEGIIPPETGATKKDQPCNIYSRTTKQVDFPGDHETSQLDGFDESSMLFHTHYKTRTDVESSKDFRPFKTFIRRNEMSNFFNRNLSTLAKLHNITITQTLETFSFEVFHNNLPHLKEFHFYFLDELGADQQLAVFKIIKHRYHCLFSRALDCQLRITFRGGINVFSA